MLGVLPTASNEEIKGAYRSLAKTFHPDVSQEDDSDETFAKINQAYSVLSDPEERSKYDYLWKADQIRLEAGDSGAPLTAEEAERAAALDRLEAAHREAERARRMATEARKTAERAKRAAAAQAREARRQAMAAASGASAAGAGMDTAGMHPKANDASQGDTTTAAMRTKGHDAVPTATKAAAAGRQRGAPAAKIQERREARREAQAAAQAAKRQAREARRHAAQVRYWAQWAEHEAESVRRAAGLEPLPSFPELLWEWQQHQRQQQQEQQRRRSGRGGDGPTDWVPPAPPPE